MEAAHDPLAKLAALNLAIIRSRHDVPAAIDELRALEGDLEGLPYPWLQAQSDWMIGLMYAEAGEAWRSIAPYEQALRLFLESNDPANAANVGGLLAEAHQELGFPDRSWDALLETLAAHGRRGDSAGLDRALDLAVLNAARDGQIEAALLFQDEQRVHQRLVANPASSRVTFLTLRAGLLRKLSRFDEAAGTLQEARGFCSSITDNTSRRLLMIEIDAEEAMRLAATDPRRSLSHFDNAFAAFEAAGDFAQLTQLLLARAEALLSIGDFERAERDFLAGLDLAELIREADDPKVRIAGFEARQSLFDHTVRFYLDARGDPVRALEVAERAKARELRSRARRNDQRQPVEAWQAEMPRATALVEYAVLPDRLEIWVVTQESIHHETVATSASDLEALVSAFLKGLEQANASSSETFAALLHDSLIRPVQTSLETSPSLIIVPDRFLTRVPFRALVDRETGQPLLSSHQLFKAPSVHLLLGTSAPSIEREARRLLAVGNPTLDRRLHPNLQNLPGAEDEARDVAALYPFNELLIGSDATPSRFIEELAGSQFLQLAVHTRYSSADQTELIFAPDSKVPSGAVELDDIDVSAFEALTLAYLSACSGATSPTGDREGLHGPTRAFLAAGVPTVIASLWGVDDQASRTLAQAFHQRFSKGNDPGSALRGAQTELRAAGAPIHHWAAYEVFLSAWPPDSGGD